MPAEPDQKPRAFQRDVDGLALIFRRLLESEDVWAPEAKQRLLKKMNSIIAEYQSKCVELNARAAAGSNPVARRSRMNGNGSGVGALRRNA